MPPDITVRKGDGNPSVFRAATQVHIDCAFRRIRNSPHNRTVSSFNGVVKKLSRQSRQSNFGFGDDDETGGIFVDAVYQPRSAFVSWHLRQLLEVPGEGIYECAGPVLVCRVNHHAYG